MELSHILILRHVWRKLSSSRRYAIHDYVNAFVKSRDEILELFEKPFSDSRVLVIGCGYHYPDVALWSTVARHVVGVDVRTGFIRSGFRTLNREYANKGKILPESVLRAAILRLTYLSYYDHLERVSGLDLDEQRQDVVIYDGSRLPFTDESFDLVCSNAVLEHVAQLETLSKEIRRVTSPSGITFHLWHNFCALSGAHVPDHMASSSPWGHLLGDHRVDSWLSSSGTYLNKLSHIEISDILSRDFHLLRLNHLDQNHNRRGLDDGFRYEGARLLTRDLEKRLSGYARDDLLTRAYSFIGTRR